VLTLPENFTVEATGPSGAAVSWTASAVDDIDGTVAVTCTPEPDTFELGDTAVSCSASDAEGNTASGGVTVTVEPYQFPEAGCIAAGNFHTCAVLGDGTARCWGSNGNGRLGDGSAWSPAPVPVLNLP